MAVHTTEKGLRVQENAVDNTPAARSTPNWRPWQLSPFYLVPLILASTAVAAALEALTQISNKSYLDGDLRAEWLNWYCQEQKSCSVAHKSGILTFFRPETISAAATFTWLYLPSLLAVSYALFWQVVDDEVKRIEPFYQASRPAGARADRTIFASYISVPPILVPLQALRWRQLAVFLSSTTYVLVGFVTPILQALMFQLQPQMIQVGYFPADKDLFEPLSRGGFRVQHQNGDGPVVGRFAQGMGDYVNATKVENEGIPRIVVYLDPTYTRAQEAVLWAATLSGSMLLWVTMRRRSGLMNDTKGIAALASLGSAHPAFLNGIAAMVDREGVKDAEEVLKKTVIHLGWAQDDNQGKAYYGFWFGLWSTEHTMPTPRGPGWLEGPKKLSSLLQRLILGRSGKRHYRILRVSIGLSLVGDLVLIGLMLLIGGTERPRNRPDDALQATVQNVNFDIRGNAGVVQAAFELTVVSVVKTLWVVVEEHTTVLAPYRPLHHGPQKAWPLLERDYASMVPGLRTVRAFRDGQLLLGGVTTVSLLLEVCLFCFGITASMSKGTAYNADAIWAIHFVVIAICGVSFLFIAATARIWLSKFPYSGRNPDTIAARLSYVCRSERLLEDVRPVAAMTREERREYLRGITRQYALRQVGDGVMGVERFESIDDA